MLQTGLNSVCVEELRTIFMKILRVFLLNPRIYVTQMLIIYLVEVLTLR